MSSFSPLLPCPHGGDTPRMKSVLCLHAFCREATRRKVELSANFKQHDIHSAVWGRAYPKARKRHGQHRCHRPIGFRASAWKLSKRHRRRPEIRDQGVQSVKHGIQHHSRIEDHGWPSAELTMARIAALRLPSGFLLNPHDSTPASLPTCLSTKAVSVCSNPTIAQNIQGINLVQIVTILPSWCRNYVWRAVQVCAWSHTRQFGSSNIHDNIESRIGLLAHPTHQLFGSREGADSFAVCVDDISQNNLIIYACRFVYFE